MSKLLKALSTSDQVTVVPAEEDNFKDYTTFLNLFYGNFTKKIKKNHIFSCSFEDNRVGNQLEVHLRESNLDVHPIAKHNAFKTGFYGRKKFEKGAKGLKQAVDERRKTIKDAEDTHLKTIEAPGINIFKQVEMHMKYRPVIPVEDQDDDLYKDPGHDVVKAVKTERKERKQFGTEMKKAKKAVMDKVKAGVKKKAEKMKGEELKKKLDEAMIFGGC